MKRGNGEGSIYQLTEKRTRKDGTIVERVRYTAAITLANGSRKKFYATTRAAVAKKLSAALQQKEKGTPFTSERLTVGEFLEQWLIDSGKPKLKPSTYQTYRLYIERHVMAALGKYPLAKLEPAHVQKLLNDLHAKGLKPRTCQQIHAILRSALNRAVKWQVVARNVASSEFIDPPRVSTNSDIKPLDAQQAEFLLAAAAEHRYRDLYFFLLTTGVRLGEALALRWHDTDGTSLVDLDARRVTIRYTLERLRGQPWRFAEPKSASGHRIVPLTAPALAALKAQRHRVAKMHMKAADVWQDYDLVFPSAIGTPLDGTNVYHEFKKLLTRAGLPNTHRVHDLRHSAATYLLSAKVDPRIVMAVMGWSQTSMLARYQHVLDPMLDDVAARLEAVQPRSLISLG